jgi:catechol 2,3-dioxygenase-like lactoylglutathione lyase family enzyme
MLSESTAFPVLAVTDMNRARGFYENTLGFRAIDEGDGGIVYGYSGGGFFVYPSNFAGTNRATALTFQVPDAKFDAEVAGLREHGVRFQTFDAPDDQGHWEGDVLVGDDGTHAAWFTDPDGNILNISTPFHH